MRNIHDFLRSLWPISHGTKGSSRSPATTVPYNQSKSRMPMLTKPNTSGKEPKGRCVKEPQTEIGIYLMHSRKSPDLVKIALIELAEIMVNNLFHCAKDTFDKHSGDLSSSSAPATSSLPELRDFTWRIMKKTGSSLATLTTALFYLTRLKQLHPACKGSYGSGHRLLFAALICASKYMYDDTYDNKTWCSVVDSFSLMEINEMESELLYFLQYRLFIQQDEYRTFACMLEERLLEQDDKKRSVVHAGPGEKTGTPLDYLRRPYVRPLPPPPPTFANHPTTYVTSSTNQMHPADDVQLRHPAAMKHWDPDGGVSRWDMHPNGLAREEDAALSENQGYTQSHGRLSGAKAVTRTTSSRYMQKHWSEHRHHVVPASTAASVDGLVDQLYTMKLKKEEYKNDRPFMPNADTPDSVATCSH